jgi:hypothetical protein
LRARVSGALTVLLVAAAVAAIGYMAVSAGGYESVDELRELESPTRVVVEGVPVDMGSAVFTLRLGGEVYMVEARGAYGVARPLSGGGEAYALFILAGESGFKVAALYPAEEFASRYGGSPAVGGVVVVEGVYDPAAIAVVEMPGAGVESMPVLWVESILKGCHTAYEAGQANVG